jgi:hypothetical protein
MRSNDRRGESQNVVSDPHDGSDGAADTRLRHGNAIVRKFNEERLLDLNCWTTPASRDDMRKIVEIEAGHIFCGRPVTLHRQARRLNHDDSARHQRVVLVLIGEPKSLYSHRKFRLFTSNFQRHLLDL